jgi:hypothetical protein
MVNKSLAKLEIRSLPARVAMMVFMAPLSNVDT